MINFLLIGIAYVIGMIPNAYILGRVFDIDDFDKIRSDDMTPNRLLLEYKRPAVFLTVLTDILKGVLVAYIGQRFGTIAVMPSALVLTAIIARNYNIFIGMKGGKGIALLTGGMIIMAPLAILPFFIFISIITYILKDLDYGLSYGVLILPVALFLSTLHIYHIFTGILTALVIFASHLDYSKEKRFRTFHDDFNRDNPYKNLD